MKICILGNIQSIHVQRWCSYFAEKDYEVHLIYSLFNIRRDINIEIQYPNLAKLKNLSIHSIPFNRFNGDAIRKFMRKPEKLTNNLFKYLSLKFLVEKIDPDLIHAHYLTDYGILASRLDFHPLILSAWGSDIIYIEKGSKQEIELKKMFDKADLVITGDKAGKKRLIELGCELGKILIQIWGVDVNRFSPLTRSDKMREKILGGNDGQIVTLVRALKDIYDIPTLINAVPRVLSKNKKVKFVVIGDGDQREYLKKMTLDLGLENNILFMGEIENNDLHPYLASSDVFIDTCYPKRGGGGIGVARMEALSSGLPMIVADHPGVENSVIDGYNGYIFKGGDPEDLAKKLILFLAKRKERETFGMRSRELAISIGNWDKNMSEIENVYNNLGKYRE